MTDQHSSGYWLEAGESRSAYVFLQHRSFTAALGGLIPKAIPVAEVRNVLDVGCGPGVWAIDVIKKYPHMRVTGIDNSAAAISDASRRVQMNKVGSAAFQQMDVTRALNFDDQSFDLVHMRSASPFIHAEAWPSVITELIRVLKPGGWLAIIDYEQGTTSSDAFNAITNVVMKAVRAVNSSLAPATLTFGAAAQLYGFFLNAYLLDVAYSFHAIDFGSSNNVDAREFIEGFLGVATNFKPLLLRLGLVESDSYDALVFRAREELTQPDTCGYGFLIATVGRKDM